MLPGLWSVDCIPPMERARVTAMYSLTNEPCYPGLSQATGHPPRLPQPQSPSAVRWKMAHQLLRS